MKSLWIISQGNGQCETTRVIISSARWSLLEVKENCPLILDPAFYSPVSPECGFVTSKISPSAVSRSCLVDRVNFQKMLTLKANRVNLGHTNFLGVLRGAELKSSVCPAQKCPKCLKIEKSNMAATAELKCIYVHIFLTKQGTNSNEMWFCRVSYMGNPMPYSFLS